MIGVDRPVSYAVQMEDGRIWRRHVDQLRRRLSSTPFTGPPALTGGPALEGLTAAATLSSERIPTASGSADAAAEQPTQPSASTPAASAPLPQTLESGTRRDDGLGTSSDKSKSRTSDEPASAGGGGGGASASVKRPLDGQMVTSSDAGLRRSTRERKPTKFFGT